MEKTKNGWYKAVSIMQYIVASIFVVGLIIMLFGGLTQGEKVAQILNEAKLLDEKGNIMVFDAESVKTLVLGMTMLMAPLIVVMYIEAVLFGKYSYMTDAEAAVSYRTCLVWTIVMFFVGGNLPAILALVGLLKIHARQKERFVANEMAAENSVNLNNDKQSEVKEKIPAVEVSDPEKMQKENKQSERLAKLEKLKENGAVTEEEYIQLKNKILKK